jgi:hypothetical protein
MKQFETQVRRINSRSSNAHAEAGAADAIVANRDRPSEEPNSLVSAFPTSF